LKNKTIQFKKIENKRNKNKALRDAEGKDRIKEETDFCL
jgi:hypothetical protein